MVTPEISNELAVIRDRLIKAKMVRSLVGKEETPEEKLRRAIFNPPTAVAKSESFVDPEQVVPIEIKVHVLRTWILDNGDLEAPEGLAPFHSYESGRVNISADDDTPENRTNAPVTTMLSIIGYDEKDNEFVINFGFENNIDIKIGFTHQEYPKRLSPMYVSGNHPLNEITIEEYKITTYWLDHCLNITQESDNPPTS